MLWCVGATRCVSDGSVDADGDADGEGIVEVPASSGDSAEDIWWVVKYDILGSPMQMVGVPTHFFKVREVLMYPSRATTVQGQLSRRGGRALAAHCVFPGTRT